MQRTCRFVKKSSSANVLEDFLIRKGSDAWLVLSEPITDKDPLWLSVKAGELVRVPLMPYLTVTDNPAAAMAFAIELGTKLFANWDIEIITEVCLCMGDELEEVSQSNGKNYFKFWLGVAVKMRRDVNV